MKDIGRTARQVGFLTLLPLAGWCIECAAAPNVPGFVVQDYVSGIAKPYRLSFSPSGVLYVGNNTNTAPERVARVPLGGGSFTPYGNSPYVDPDAVVFDISGAISGTPGALLVGRAESVGMAFLTAVLPNQVVVDLEGPSTLLGNPDDFAFDQSGRLLMTDFQVGNVLVKSSSNMSSILFTIPSRPTSIAVDANNHIYTSAEDGIVRSHAPDGSLLDDAFLTGLADAPLAFGPGGITWGTDLYSVDNTTGELLRVAPNGTVSTIGIGFGLITEVAFGPDSLMYLSAYDDSLVLRIFPETLVSVPGSAQVSNVALAVGPNPARGLVQLNATFPSTSATDLSLISVDGRLVRRIYDGPVSAGHQSWTWDRRDASGRTVPPGIYFARLSTGQFSVTRRIALIE